MSGPDAHAWVVLDVAVGRVTKLDVPPPFGLRADGDSTARVEAPPGSPLIEGSAAELAAWLLGRGDGAGLRCDGGRPSRLPDVPAVWS